ncbi:OLC1v1008947C1 [Oldenlandia corymbosa var. corymbosa]|uniref:OLC1v1008947C1 n=1 Tax=Oldenlandia corymbosa var. corymbosa TaxID=529605 RepID=A0AAV1DMX0_OLDCO|nr:OLC1v1008947C1 [Oldenlandia corymbosa var. corymbosa]
MTIQHMGRPARKEVIRRQGEELDMLVQKIEGSSSRTEDDGNRVTPPATGMGSLSTAPAKLSEGCASGRLRDKLEPRVAEVNAKRQTHLVGEIVKA